MNALGNKIDVIGKLLICALVLAVIVDIALKQQWAMENSIREYQANSEKHKNVSAEKIADICGTSIISQIRKNCIARKIESYEKQQIANKDLEAQQLMAYWARWMTIAAIIQAVAATIGVVWLIKTFKQSQKFIAQADETIEATKQVGMAQSRAYLRCEGGKFNFGKSFIECFISLENQGITPARNVRTISSLRVI